MSLPRLTFLYPHLFGSVRCSETSLSCRSLRASKNQRCRAGFSTTTKSKQETYAQRYGPANEPSPPPQLPSSSSQSSVDNEEPKSLSTAIEKEVKATPPLRQEEKKSQPTSKESDKLSREDTSKASITSSAATVPKTQELSTRLDAAESHPKEQAIPPDKGIAEAKPLERLLQMNSPDDEHKPPHLHAPLYVHHFDTFTLVRDLEKGGFTQAQSVTLMKAVRSLLALNLDVAREGLVSKSDVENVHFPRPPPASQP